MTAILERTAVGSPYRVGDALLIEHDGTLVEATVRAVERQPSGPFGRHWRITVTFADLLAAVQVDDNGYNRTIGRRVMPSDRVVD